MKTVDRFTIIWQLVELIDTNKKLHSDYPVFSKEESYTYKSELNQNFLHSWENLDVIILVNQGEKSYEKNMPKSELKEPRLIEFY